MQNQAGIYQDVEIGQLDEQEIILSNNNILIENEVISFHWRLRILLAIIKN